MIRARSVEVKISFHGADRDVTGSCHLVEAAGKRILIDCGFFQGGRDLEEENAAPFGFDAASIDTLLLTHAHLDHCGRVPLLHKRGFRGEIIATGATRELARLVMLDAAHLQEEDARRRAQRNARGRDPADGAAALFDARRAQRLRRLRPRRRLRPADRAGAGHGRHLLRRRPYSRLGQHPARTRGRRRSAGAAVFRRSRQRRPAAAAPAGRSARGRRRRDGDDLRRSPAQAARAVDRGALPGDRRNVPARRQRRHPDLRARARAGAALRPARRGASATGCRRRCRCFSIRRWRSRRPRSSSATPRPTSRTSPSCSATGATRSACRGSTSRARPPIRRRSTASAAAR